MSGRRSSVPVLVAVPAVAALICALFVVTIARRDDPRSVASGRDDPSSSTITMAAVGPVDANGIPVGWPHDEAGARDAAVAYVESTGRFVLAGPLRRHDLVDAFASKRYGAALLEQADRYFDRMSFALGSRGLTVDDLVWEERAVSAATDQASATSARVRVWSMQIVGVRTMVAKQHWRTSTVSLVWQDGDWKVDAWNSEDGPTPAPSDPSEASSPGQVESVVSWPPAHRPGAR